MTDRVTTIETHSGEHGSWLLASGKPAAQLRAYIHRYEGYVESRRVFSRHLQAASTRIPLIINFGAPFRLDGPGYHNQEVRSFIAGLHDGPTLVGSGGPQHCLQIDLTPLGARRIVGLPMHELRNCVVELDDLLGRQSALLAEQLHDASDWSERFALVDAALTSRIERSPDIPRPISAAWTAIEQSDGRASIGGLAVELGWSHKHLIVQFREHVGLPPKTLARIRRFERAMRAVNDSERVCLATVAQTAGYFDQAHLNRDFRQFAGLTPAELRRRRIPGIEGLVGD
jgi:AraC-like DNA-binding protein